MTFSVLFVCTGNVCRSPIAERLFRACVPSHSSVSAASAGTAALVGSEMDRASAAALEELGVSARGHTAQQATDDLIAQADLILTAERRHRSIILAGRPSAYRQCFTMREFARLGARADREGASSDGGLRARVAHVADHRGQSEIAIDGANDDIGDPYGAPIEVARACAADVSAAVGALIDILALSLTPHD